MIIAVIKALFKQSEKGIKSYPNISRDFRKEVSDGRVATKSLSFRQFHSPSIRHYVQTDYP